MPLVEAMVAGVPVVTRGAGAVADTVADAALVLAAADPSYVAAAVHRVCTDEQLRATLTAAGRRRAAELSGDAAAAAVVDADRHAWWGDREREGGLRDAALRHPGHGWRRDGGAPAGRAPARPHGLGGRGPHDLRARPPSPGPTSCEPGTTEINGVPVHRHPSAHGRLPDFYGLDGTAPPGPAPGDTLEQGRRWVDYNGPVSPELVDAVVRVGRRRRRLLPVPVPPHRGHHRQGAGAGGAPPGRARRAGALPAGVPRHLRGRGRLLLPHGVRTHARRADVPGGRAPADRARARRGRVRGAGPARRRARWGWATAPTSSAWGGSTSTRAPRCWRRTSPPTRSGIPDRWPWPWSGRSRSSCRRTPTSS